MHFKNFIIICKKCECTDITIAYGSLGCDIICNNCEKKEQI